MPTYKFTAPNGKTVSVTGDTPPSESEVDEIFKAAGVSSDVGSSTTVPEAPKGRDFKILGVNIHVPPEEKPRLDSNIATVGGVGIAPEDALMGGMAVRGVKKAASAGGAIAGAREAVSQVSPVVKFEIVRRGLDAVGVPPAISTIAALGLSGYRRGSKPAEVPTPTPDPHLDLSQRVPAGALTQQQIGERLAAARAQGMTAPQVEPVKNPATPVRVPLPERQTAPAPPGPPEPSMQAEPFNAPRVKPPTPKELNEQAIAVHRSITTAAREAGVALKEGDLDALKSVVRSGVPAEEAVAALKATRVEDPAAELARRFNLPSDAERTFPPNKSGLPTKPPTARKARGKIADLADMPVTKAETTTLYHGTSSKPFDKFSGDVAYLVNEPTEAAAYANDNIIGGGRGVGKSRVLEVKAPKGKTRDITSEINTELEEGGDVDVVVAEMAKKARSEGYDYLSFDHPSSVSQTDIKAVVALNPSKLTISGSKSTR